MADATIARATVAAATLTPKRQPLWVLLGAGPGAVFRNSRPGLPSRFHISDEGNVTGQPKYLVRSADSNRILPWWGDQYPPGPFCADLASTPVGSVHASTVSAARPCYQLSHYRPKSTCESVGV